MAENSQTSALKKAAAKPAKAGATDARAEAKKPATKKAPPAAVEKASEQRTTENETAIVKLISDEQRYRMIAEAAYFRAESRQFKSDPVRDWIEAEREIETLLDESE
ncbi:MAG: DUF2934 domain-containing protein [Candidatus Accumulibacter sp.]|jgi:hypothetical protein|nr:DUF2934 domain-containing protein [Accumulibacter sp.]